MATTDGIPLETVTGWPPALVRKLAQQWITTVEQIVAICARPEGIRTLATHLDIGEAELHQLVALARAHLPRSVVETLERPVDTRQFGLGARKPKGHKK